jgi:alkylation response protein AidB-like acyl-CoA dehydrogenase
VFLVAVRSGDGTDDISLLLVDARADGVSCEALPNIGGYPLSVVRFDGVATPADNVVGTEGGGWTPLADACLKGAVLQTATIIGAARAVLDMTNQYAKDRVQFGSPIGQYQAVQYLVTDILIDLHRADLLARQAAFRIDAGKPFTREAAIAVAFGKQAAAHLHRQAHEVHAGIAFIDEHDLQLYSRRSKFWENHLGDARHYQEIVADTMHAPAS